VSVLTGHDPIDRLRAADPIRAQDVPDASLARVSARVQEHMMSHKQVEPTVPPIRRPLALIGGLALAGAVALTVAYGSGIFGTGSGVRSPGPVAAIATPSQSPTPSARPAPSGNPGPSARPPAGSGVASCLVYDPANLPIFDVVFDGTITTIAGDQVTFEVNDGWKGVGGSVTLTAPKTDIALVGPMPDFKVGNRYLVTAGGSTINACGYTLAYDAGTAADWAAVFGR
jgi:hypothetical protein